MDFAYNLLFPQTVADSATAIFNYTLFCLWFDKLLRIPQALDFLPIDGEEIVLKDTVNDLSSCCNFKKSWLYYINERNKKASMQLKYIRRSSLNSLSSSVWFRFLEVAYYQKLSMHLQFGLRLKTNVSE